MTNSILTTFLSELGLTQEEIAIYLTLKQSGTVSAVTIAKESRVARTTIYRLLTRLTQLGLVDELIDEKKRLFRLSSADKLLSLIKQQKSRYSNLENDFTEVSKLFGQSETLLAPGTQVRYFRGISGLEQMEWNALSAKEIYSYTFLTLDDVFGPKLARQFREERFIRKIAQKDIISTDDPYLNKKTVQAMRANQFFTYYQVRYLPFESIKIDHQTSVYNDTIAMWNWYRGEVVGVEIQNPYFASLQKQIFQFLWEQAKEPEELLKTK